MSIYQKVIKVCAVVMGISGLVILVTTLYPIFSYEWQAEMKYPKLISPLIEEETADFIFDSNDSTKLSNWFDDPNVKDEVAQTQLSFFTLSVPKLKIDNAIVKIGGEELAESLIQYPGTALPGEIGNSVIFGHSILPTFYNPKNYLSIFSLLGDLEEGDKVYVNYENKQFVYEVKDLFEVKPKDVQILEQNVVDSYLTLVTCTPPGHPLKPKRLIVRAKLVETS